jgi:outer membrane lipase/esterase
MDTATQFGRTLSTRMDTGSPRDGDRPEGIAVYLVGDSFSQTLDASRTNDQFKVTSVGLTGGVEYGFGSGMVGAAVNVSRPKAKFFNDAARDEARSVQAGIYGGFGIAGGFVQGYAGVGRDRHDLTRAGVISQLDADPKGRHVTAGAKAGYLMPVRGLRVGPVVALDYARARVDGYTEQGDAALTLNVGSERFSSLRGSAGAEVRGDFGDNGLHVRPYAAAMIEKEFHNDGRTFDYSQTSAPVIVNHFRIDDDRKAYGRLSAGLSAALAAGISVNATLSGTVAKDQGNETTGHLGFRAAF